MHLRSVLLPIILVIAGFATFWPIAAVAQIKQDQNMCVGKGGAETADLRILSCTAAIENSRGSSKQLAIAYTSRGAAFLQKRDRERALQDYDQAIRLNSRYSEAFDGRCWARVTVNRLEDALKDCRESLRLRPNFAPTLGTLGLVYLRLGRFDDAVATYTAALQIDPKSAYALYGRGMARLKKGDTASGEADIAASKAIKDVTEEMTGYGVK
jgi:tetratricopeptide (TPR) repeat protein